jgi:hypothetical protein
MKDFGKSKAKFKTTKQDYVAGFVRKTRHFSSREVIVVSNFKQEFTTKL